MFSLINFHNEQFYIVASKNVRKIEGKNCIVKYNGGKYSAFLVAKSDNNAYLRDIKRNNEIKIKIPREGHSFLPLGTISQSEQKTSDDPVQNMSESTKNLDKKQTKSHETTEQVQIAISEEKFVYETDIEENISIDGNVSSFCSLLPTNSSANIFNSSKSSEVLESTKTFAEKQKTFYDSTEKCTSAEIAQNEIHVDSFSSLMPDNSSANINNNSSYSEVVENTMNLDTFSSVNMEESAVSEYIPDSSVHNNTSVEVIDVPLNITNIVVPHSNVKSKKHFCIFCKTLQCKISRHIFLKHKTETEVKKALRLPVKSKERSKIIADLRKKGDFLHNTSVKHNSGFLIVSRRQQTKFNNSVDDYICCKMCKGFFSKKTLKLHVSKCNSSRKNSHTNFADGRRLTQYMHPVANDVLKCKVFPTLRTDYITKAIRYDELIIKFGNKMTEKYSAQHQHDMIRANLRLLGRFKLNVQKFKPEISELKEIFKPRMFDVCIKAVRVTANWDESIMGFKTPAVAQNITSLIKKCAKKQRAELIKENNEDLKSQLDNFLLLWEEETPTLINKKALEDQTNQKRDKKVFLPSKEDIKKLYIYLKDLINTAMEKLMSGFCVSAWTALVQQTLTLVQIFNRRRAGEIERITIENFRNKEVITDTIDKDILKTLSKESVKFAKQFIRINLRGKLGRTVSVLLCPLTKRAVDLILKYRSEAGISKENNYIFSKPTSSKLAKQYFRACPLLKRFAEECGAQIPESLRGTNLRKHIATYTALLNAEEAAVDKLANFMGHHKDIHKNIYRVSVPVAEITCISKILTGAIGDEEEVEDDASNDDAEEDGFVSNITNKNFGKQNTSLDKVNTSLDTENFCLENSFEETSGNCSSSSKKRRSTSPFGKTKRRRWNYDEKAAIFSAFGDFKALKNLPTLNECMKVISEQVALKGRTPQQVKSWIDNQRRYNKIVDCPDGFDELSCTYKDRTTTQRNRGTTVLPNSYNLANREANNSTRADKRTIRTTTIKRKVKP